MHPWLTAGVCVSLFGTWLTKNSELWGGEMFFMFLFVTFLMIALTTIVNSDEPPRRQAGNIDFPTHCCNPVPPAPPQPQELGWIGRPEE